MSGSRGSLCTYCFDLRTEYYLFKRCQVPVGHPVLTASTYLLSTTNSKEVRFPWVTLYLLLRPTYWVLPIQKMSGSRGSHCTYCFDLPTEYYLFKRCHVPVGHSVLTASTYLLSTTNSKDVRFPWVTLYLLLRPTYWVLPIQRCQFPVGHPVLTASAYLLSTTHSKDVSFPWVTLYLLLRPTYWVLPIQKMSGSRGPNSTYCYTTTTMVIHARFSNTLYVHYLSCFNIALHPL